MTNTDAKSDKPSGAPSGGRHNRSPKNLLIERRFQLKYTYLIVILTIVISAPLGALLYHQATSTVQVAAEANAAARDSVEQARQLNTRLAFEAKMSAHGDAARVAEATKENDAATAKIDERAKTLADQQAALEGQRATIASTLAVTLTLLVVLVGLLGVYVTHKVAGPIHRMRALFKEVGDGQFSPFVPLRKGDELQEFFSEFSEMVQRLRDRQKKELDRLDTAITHAESAGADTDSVAELRVAREAMRTAIAKSIPPPANN